MKRILIGIALSFASGALLAQQDVRLNYYDGCIVTAKESGWTEKGASAFCWCSAAGIEGISTEEAMAIIKESALPDRLMAKAEECSLRFPPGVEPEASGPYYSNGALRPPPRPIASLGLVEYWRSNEPDLWAIAERINRENRAYGENPKLASEAWSRLIVRLTRKHLDEMYLTADNETERNKYLGLIFSSFPVFESAMNEFPELWKRAIGADDVLMDFPEFSNLPPSERFEILADSLADYRID